MLKLFWVALPLVLFGAGFALQWLRRRPPSRLALNIGSSLLLLAYLLATAGLGIFWVANQQLPVFDWHYLFGYGTVLLVTLHLALNFRVVWRYLVRPRKPPARLASDAQARRRGLLDAMGLLLTAGLGFVLGMRHGRSELHLAPPPAGATGSDAAPGAAALALVERFHAFSSHSRAGVMLRAPGADWGAPPEATKHYPGASTLALPPPRGTTATRFDAGLLGTVLWHTTGVTARRGGLSLRASPSSGGLFPTELYVAVRRVAHVPPGLWHYDPQAQALALLRPGEPDAGTLGIADEPWLRDADAIVIASAVFRRTGHKYRDRTYRYVLADLGHALENMRAAATAVGGHADILDSFDESRAAATLGLDENEEGVLACTVLRGPGSTPVPPRNSPTPQRWKPAPLHAVESSPLGITAAVHTASSLRGAPPLTAPPPGHAGQSPPLPAGAVTLRGAATTPTLGSIAARRSVRRFSGTPLPLDSLAGVLDGMTARVGPTLSAAVRVNIVAHAVSGLPPGVYRHEPRQRALVPRRVPVRLRAAARAAALDQDVIGDAAVVFVLSIDRAVFAADLLGPARGYRHAFLEAGLLGERIYLEAGARGLGACAVGAFYDEESAALIAIDPVHEWVVHFAALGVPST